MLIWISVRPIQNVVFLNSIGSLFLWIFPWDGVLWEHILSNAIQVSPLVLGIMFGHHCSSGLVNTSRCCRKVHLERAWKLYIAPLPHLSLFNSSIWWFLTCTLYKVSKHKYFPEFFKLFQQIIKSKVGVVGTLDLMQLVWSTCGQGLPWWLSW